MKSHKLISRILTLLLILYTSVGYADSKSIESALYYQTASEMCQVYAQNDNIKKITETLKITVHQGYEGIKTVVQAKGFGLSAEASNLIMSPEYNKALNECFGSFSENRLKWDSFTLTIIMSDAVAQTASYYVLYIGGNVLFARLGNLTKTLKAIPALAALPNVRQRLVLAGKIFSYGITAYFSYDFYKKYKLLTDSSEQKKQAEIEINERIIPQFDSDLKMLLAAISKEIALEKQKPLELRNQERIKTMTKMYYDSIKENQVRKKTLISQNEMTSPQR